MNLYDVYGQGKWIGQITRSNRLSALWTAYRAISFHWWPLSVKQAGVAFVPDALWLTLGLPTEDYAAGANEVGCERLDADPNTPETDTPARPFDRKEDRF